MRRILCVILALLLLPRAALAQSPVLVEEYPLAMDAPVTYVHDAAFLADGSLLVRWYSPDESEFARAQFPGETLYAHHYGVFSITGEDLWTGLDLTQSYDLNFSDNLDEVLVNETGFVRDYFPAQDQGAAYCWTAYDTHGQVTGFELALQTRAEEDMRWVRNVPGYTVEGFFMQPRLDIHSHTTGARKTLAWDQWGVSSIAVGDGKLFCLVRPEDSEAVIRVFDEALQEIACCTAPFRFGETTDMVYHDGQLICLPLYAGDWPAYYVYTLDLVSGRFAEERTYVQLPNEYCYLRGVIPCGDGLLMLIEDASTGLDALPDRVLGKTALYRMDAEGNLSLCLELGSRDARLLRVGEDGWFTLLVTDEATGLCTLRTYTTN